MPDTSTHFHIIIAGGGPAGSTAAYILCKAGLNVLIIDKNKFPRKKLCGGLITYKTLMLIERVFGATPADLHQPGIITYESDRYEIYGKRRLISQRRYKIPFRFVDREKYDNYLLQKARQAGATLVEGDGVKRVDASGSRIVTYKGWEFTADVIVGADGVNSRVRRSFPVDLFGRDDWMHKVASAHEAVISRDKIKKQVDHPILYFGFLKDGYAWLFPNRDTIIAGICGLRDKAGKNILHIFREFLKEHAVTSAGDEKIQSYVLPYGCYLPSPVFRNIVLIGDAAGLADPLLGEGIYYAQRSGELAARTIMHIRDHKKSFYDMETYYLPALQEHIRVEMEYAEKIKHAIFSYLKINDFFLLSKVMHMCKDKPVETIHGLRSYKWMKKIPE
jgi:geranylgeranyl reductase family protein